MKTGLKNMVVHFLWYHLVTCLTEHLMELCFACWFSTFINLFLPSAKIEVTRMEQIFAVRFDGFQARCIGKLQGDICKFV